MLFLNILIFLKSNLRMIEYILQMWYVINVYLSQYIPWWLILMYHDTWCIFTPVLVNITHDLALEWLLTLYMLSCLKKHLTHWGRVTHICISKLAIIGSDNGLSPGRHQAFIWTNDGVLLIRPLGTNFSEILIGNQTFSFKKMHLEMSSVKGRPFCLALNVLTHKQL